MIYDYDKEKNKKKLMRTVILVLSAIALLMVVGLFYGVFVEYLEIKEIGEQFTSVFWINFRVKIIAQLLSFCFVFAIFFTSTLLIRKYVFAKISVPDIFKKLTPIILLAFIISFFASGFIRETVYTRYLMFANSTMFGQTDPIFNQDIGYYLFQRPFLVALVDSISGVWLFNAFYVAILYAVLYASINFGSLENILREKGIVLHNVINIVAFLVIKAVTYKFRAEDLLYSTFGQVVGAGYTDVAVWLRYFRVAPFLLALIVVATLVFLFKGKIKWALLSIAAFPAIWILVNIASAGVQNFVVSPNEISLERPYLQHNIDYTRQAYNLHNIIEKEFAVGNTLTLEDIEGNAGTIDNIRITDYPATLTVINQLQGIRNYYRFADTDILAYEIDGKPTAVFTGVRELNKQGLDSSAQTYINMRFRFTHGFGVVMNPVSQVTREGHPVFLIRDIPSESVAGAPEVTQPRIYFGELTNDYVIVNTTEDEFDYSDGQQEADYRYTGPAGIELSFMQRLIFAIKQGDYRMMIARQITPESKLLLNRNVLERVQKVAPFLYYDHDPYIVINEEGRLKWVVDVYTASSFYPYSQSVGNINYIRNPAKAVVDAYDGTVDFYITDPTEPIISVYSDIYPKLFNDEPLPADIARHIRYPETIFNIQAEVLKRYHVTNSTTFYNRNDYWEVAKEKYAGRIKDVEPYYSLMQLPETDIQQEELVLMLPYTLRGRENMVSWLAARSDYDNYGEMILYRFPRGINVYGTMQIENRIDSNTDISREMSLWDTGGSSVIRGNVLVIPIKDSILYVEPVYITGGTEASLPEMKRVVVAYKDQIVMEPTIEEAFARLFGTPMPERPDMEIIEGAQTIQALVSQALKSFTQMKSASQAGEWEDFGRALNSLEKLLEQLEQEQIEDMVEEIEQEIENIS